MWEHLSSSFIGECIAALCVGGGVHVAHVARHHISKIQRRRDAALNAAIKRHVTAILREQANKESNHDVR